MKSCDKNVMEAYNSLFRTTIDLNTLNTFAKAHFKLVSKKSFDTVSQAVFMTLKNVFE